MLHCPLFKVVLTLAFALSTGAAVADPEKTYLEKDGIILFEAEDGQIADGWEVRTELAGYDGAGYLEWRGPNYFPSGSAGNGIITYHFRVETAGNYQLRLRNYIAEGDSNTESNDSWVRLATGVDIPEEQALNGWSKVYTNTGGQWSWASRTVDHAGVAVRQYFAQGDHTIEISGRSRGHAIDMITLYRYDDVNYSPSAINRWELSEYTTSDGTLVTPGEYPEPEEGEEGETETVVERPRENLEPADDTWTAIDDYLCAGNTLALPAIDSAVFNSGNTELAYISQEDLQVTGNGDIALLKFNLSLVPPFTGLQLEYATDDIAADATIDYSLASHSQWSSSADDENSEYAPYPMLQLGTSSGGWLADTRHRSTLTPILIGSTHNTIMVRSQNDNENLGLLSHIEAVNAPRLLLTGDNGFCNSWQSNIDSAMAIAPPDEDKELDVEVVKNGEYVEPSDGSSSGGSLSIASFGLLLLTLFGRLFVCQRAAALEPRIRC